MLTCTPCFTHHRTIGPIQSNHDPLNLVQRDLIVAPVVEARGACGFMVGHLLGDLDLAAIAQRWQPDAHSQGPTVRKNTGFQGSAETP